MLVFPMYVLAVGEGQPYFVRTVKGRLLPAFTTQEAAIEFAGTEENVEGVEFALFDFGPHKLLELLNCIKDDCDLLMIDPDRTAPYMTSPIASVISTLQSHVDGLDQSPPG